MKPSRVFVIVKAMEAASHSWSFITYTLFLRDQGLSLMQTTWVNLAFMLVGFFLDPWTGRLADRYGQKRVYLCGQLFWTAGMLIYGLSHSIWGFFAAEITAAVGSALISEALESWLRCVTTEEETHQGLSQAGTLATLCTIPASYLGVQLAQHWGYQLPWLISAGTTLGAAVISWRLLRTQPEEKDQKERESVPSVGAIIRNVWRNPTLRRIIVVNAVTAGAFQALNMFWAPALSDLSSGSWWFGLMWVGISLAISLGNWLARKMKPTQRNAGISIILTGLPVLIGSMVGGLPALPLGFLLHEIGRAAFRPLLFTSANKHLDNLTRSTANSTISASRTFGAAIGLLISGFLTTFLTIPQTWIVSAIALILTGLWLMRQKE